MATLGILRVLRAAKGNLRLCCQSRTKPKVIVTIMAILVTGGAGYIGSVTVSSCGNVTRTSLYWTIWRAVIARLLMQACLSIMAEWAIARCLDASCESTRLALVSILLRLHT